MIIVEHYIHRLKNLGLVPDFLTKTQKEHLSHVYIYRALMAKTLQFKDIEFLPKLSSQACSALQDFAHRADFLTPESYRYQNLYEIIHYADSGFTTLEIESMAERMDKKQGILYLTLFALPLFGWVLYKFISVAIIKNKERSAQDMVVLFGLIVSLLVWGILKQPLIDNPLRWLYYNLTGLDARVLQPKDSEVSTYFNASHYNLITTDESGALNVLLNKGVLTRSFIEHFDLSDEQFKNLNHPATTVMLTSNDYAVKLSHFLQEVGKLSQQQAWVLANPVVYSAFNWHIPYNFSSRQRNLRNLLKDAKELNAVAIVTRNRRHALLLSLIYPIITFGTYPLFLKPLSMPKLPALRVAIVMLAPLVVGLLIAALSKLASYLLPGNGFFKKTTTLENCIFVQSGLYRPESLDISELGEQPLLLNATSNRLDTRREPLRQSLLGDNPGRTLGRIDISPDEAHYPTRMTPRV